MAGFCFVRFLKHKKPHVIIKIITWGFAFHNLPRIFSASKILVTALIYAQMRKFFPST